MSAMRRRNTTATKIPAAIVISVPGSGVIDLGGNPEGGASRNPAGVVLLPLYSARERGDSLKVVPGGIGSPSSTVVTTSASLLCRTNLRQNRFRKTRQRS